MNIQAEVVSCNISSADCSIQVIYENLLEYSLTRDTSINIDLFESCKMMARMEKDSISF
jgi:hypothetical protein